MDDIEIIDEAERGIDEIAAFLDRVRAGISIGMASERVAREADAFLGRVRMITGRVTDLRYGTTRHGDRFAAATMGRIALYAFSDECDLFSSDRVGRTYFVVYEPTNDGRYRKVIWAEELAR